MDLLTILKKKFDSKESRNAKWIIISRISQTALTFVVGVISARMLGPSNYGILSYVASFTSMFLSICTLGFDELIVKYLVEKPENEGEYLGTAIFFRLISSFVSILLISLMVNILNPRKPEVVIISLLHSVSLLFFSFDSMRFWFNAHLKSAKASLAQTIAYFIASCYKIFLLAIDADLKWFSLINSVDYIIIALSLVYLYRKSNGKALKISFKLGISMLKDSYHYILSGAMVSIYAYTDRIMMGTILTVESVGQYSVANQLCTSWAFLLIAIIDSYRPGIFEAKSTNELMYKSKLIRLYQIVFVIGIGAGILITLFANPIITILFGSEYIEAIPIMRVLVWATLLSYICVVNQIWQISEKKQRYAKRFCGIGAVVNVVLNMVLIPTVGNAGAAVATLITQLSVALIIPAFFKPTKECSANVLISLSKLPAIIKFR